MFRPKVYFARERWDVCLVGSRTPDDPVALGRRSWSWWLMVGIPKLELFKVCEPRIWFIFMTFPLFIFTPIQTLREKILLLPSVFILFIYLCAVFIFNEISYGPYLCHEVVWEQT